MPGLDPRSKTTVVHLTTVHAPFDTRIFQNECRSLAEAGWRVVLVAPHDHDEIRDGVEMRAIPGARSRPARMSIGVVRAFRAAVRERPALLHLHDPELLPAGLLLRATGRRVLYDAHEDLPREIFNKEWLPHPSRRPIAATAGAVEALAVRTLSGVVCATPAIAARFPERRTTLVQNFPRVDELSVSGPPHRDRPETVLYLGDLHPYRGAWQMVDAMQLLPETSRAELVLAGRFVPEQLEPQLRERPGWARARAAGWLDRREVLRELARARVGLLLYHPRPNYLEAQPRKLFEYMAAGIPTVVSDFPLWRRIVEEAGCGLAVDPLDPAAISRAVVELLENPDRAQAMGERGRIAARRSYGWQGEADRLIALYDTLLDR